MLMEQNLTMSLKFIHFALATCDGFHILLTSEMHSITLSDFEKHQLILQNTYANLVVHWLTSECALRVHNFLSKFHLVKMLSLRLLTLHVE